MAIFSVAGPYDIPCLVKPGGKLISEDLSAFWEKCKKVRNGKGCYLLAIRAGKGFTPLYVGKTTRTFEKECFTSHKLVHYHHAMSDYAKGTPVMFFIVLPRTQGKPNSKEITEVEDFLIQVGRTANSALRNIKGNTVPNWSIRGVIRGGQGKVAKGATQLRKLLKM